MIVEVKLVKAEIRLNNTRNYTGLYSLCDRHSKAMKGEMRGN